MDVSKNGLKGVPSGRRWVRGVWRCKEKVVVVVDVFVVIIEIQFGRERERETRAICVEGMVEERIPF